MAMVSSAKNQKQHVGPTSPLMPGRQHVNMFSQQTLHAENQNNTITAQPNQGFFDGRRAQSNPRAATQGTGVAPKHTRSKSRPRANKRGDSYFGDHNQKSGKHLGLGAKPPKAGSGAAQMQQFNTISQPAGPAGVP